MTLPEGSNISGLCVVDVCGTLVRDDTTLGLLHHHFSQDATDWFRLWCLRVLTTKYGPFLVVFKILEHLTGQHVLKFALLYFLKGTKVSALDASANSYAALLLAQRCTPSVWHALSSPLRPAAIVLASASLEPVVAQLAKRMGVLYVASTLGHKAGVLTGRLAADLTGQKIPALHAKLGADCLQGPLWVLSDNFSDRSLLEQATKAFVVLHNDKHRLRWKKLDAVFLRV